MGKWQPLFVLFLIFASGFAQCLTMDQENALRTIATNNGVDPDVYVGIFEMLCNRDADFYNLLLNYTNQQFYNKQTVDAKIDNVEEELTDLVNAKYYLARNYTDLKIAQFNESLKSTSYQQLADAISKISFLYERSMEEKTNYSALVDLLNTLKRDFEAYKQKTDGKLEQLSTHTTAQITAVRTDLEQQIEELKTEEQYKPRTNWTAIIALLGFIIIAGIYLALKLNIIKVPAKLQEKKLQTFVLEEDAKAVKKRKLKEKLKELAGGENGKRN